ncbi:MAG: amidase [Nocardioides alkalitolerans]
MTRVHAFRDDALGDLDAVGLAEHLAAGKVSAVEVVDAAIARCEAVGPTLNGLALDTYTRARRQARDPRAGFFSGVPTFVKDNVAVEGLPTQDGCDAFVARPAPKDGDFFRMYGATGVVPIGKSQLSEFGFSASAEHPRLGPVRNPWDPTRTAGASSAGSSAFVAAGVVPIAHANDGGGSIRIPAAACGLVGLKPTRNRFAQDKVFRDMPVRIVADGVVTRSVRDTAAYLREAERVYRNLALAPVGDITRPGTKRLRVAVVTTSIDTAASPEVREATLGVARLLEELGHHVVELEQPPVPPSFRDDFLLYWGFLSTFLVSTGRATHRGSWDPSRLDNLTRGLARYAARRMHRLPGAIARLARSERLSAAFFADHDVVLTPTVATTTPEIGHLDPMQDFDTVMTRLMDWVAFTPLQNATGEPAISLPLATGADGMPLGVMLGAGRGREATLLEVAYELEEARPFARIQG